MKKIAICGEFLNARKPIGVFRVAYEIIVRLDKFDDSSERFELVLPENTRNDIPLKNIKKIVLPFGILKRWWKHIQYAAYCKQYNRLPLIIDSWGPVTIDSYFYIHDINYLEHPEFFNGLKRKLIRIDRILNNALAVRRAKLIFTISDFQKKKILEAYKISADKVRRIYHGWEHMNRILRDDTIFEKYPNIKKGDYFLAVGTVIKYKNFAWVLSFAKNNPQFQFVFAGNIMENDACEGARELQNVMFLGYVSDGELKSLMSECKAFIFPSLYEGFGLPPLEAIACGAVPIVSTSTCLPEIYGENVYYIDPYDMNIKYENICTQTPKDPKMLLKKYSWDKAASDLIRQIEENETKIVHDNIV